MKTYEWRLGDQRRCIFYVEKTGTSERIVTAIWYRPGKGFVVEPMSHVFYRSEMGARLTVDKLNESISGNHAPYDDYSVLLTPQLLAEYPMPANMTEPIDFDDDSPDHLGDKGDYSNDKN